MSDKHPIEAGAALRLVASRTWVGRTRTDYREGFCFCRALSTPTLASTRETPPVRSAKAPKANDMRLTFIETAAILTIGVVTMQLHSAERSNPALAIQAFLAASSERVMARLERPPAKAAQHPATAAPN